MNQYTPLTVTIITAGNYQLSYRMLQDVAKLAVQEVVGYYTECCWVLSNWQYLK
jgi:hypothetical protein